MDQAKVGRFISSMRKELGFTQEELGEKLGVTNKTVSRWETGKYMPDIDKLQDLSRLLGVSVNELLQGERIEDARLFVQKADENLVEALAANPAFDLQDRIAFFKRKWLKEHKGYLALWVVIWLACFAAGLFIRKAVVFALLSLLAVIIYGHVRNQMMIYVEQRAFRE